MPVFKATQSVQHQPKMKLVENLTEFSNGTSIHGFVHMAKSSSSYTKRIIWFVIFSVVMLYAGMQISSEFKCEYINKQKNQISTFIGNLYFGILVKQNAACRSQLGSAQYG